LFSVNNKREILSWSLLSKKYIELSGFTVISGANEKDCKWEEWWKRKLG
jgi:hypothetical protein